MSDLARALTALVFARMPVELDREALTKRFERAAQLFDQADREYRVAIERILSAQHAREMLAAMESFRSEVVSIREQARAAAPYGDFDPLDIYVPSFPGSHADAVRAANLGDRVRQAVADARAEVNMHVGALLSPSEIEQLVEAKRQREAAFEGAILEAVPKDVGRRLGAQLVSLAEGWY